MALALYRKYRPATFADVVGQEHVTEPLRTALAAGRINHAYLFSGPRGCGKTSSARILARSLNCELGPTPDPCGVCPSCLALAPEGSGNVDVIELDAASHGGVDDARELRDRAFYAPAESRYRVFIVDEAHMVTTQGFNALLKIVEEPPDHLVFVFATTEPDKVLPTIRSRTHHYPFRLIPPGTLRALLERICDDEGATVAPPVFPLVIRAGGGSARDTLSVLDQLLAGSGPEGVTYERAVALLGVTDVALIDDMVDALAASDGAAVFEAVDRLVEAGHDPRRFAADLLDRLRDLTLLQAVPDAAERDLVDAPSDELERMTDQAARLGAATLSRFAEIVHTGLTEMRGATAPRLLLELLCGRMLLPGASTSDAALLQRLERMERRADIAVEPRAGAAPVETPGVAPGEAPGGAGDPAAGAAGPVRTFQRPSRTSEPGAEPSEPTVAEPGAPMPAAAGQAAASPPSQSRAETAQRADRLPPPPVRHTPSAQSPSPGPVAPSPPADQRPPAEESAADQPVTDQPAAERSPAEQSPAEQSPAERAPLPAAAAPTTESEPDSEAAPRQPSAPGSGVGMDAAAVRRAWPDILDAAKHASRSTGAMLVNATVKAVDGDTLVLSIGAAPLARRLSEQRNTDIISAALRTVLGVVWQVRCEHGGAGGGPSGGGAGPARPAPSAPSDNGGSAAPRSGGPAGREAAGRAGNAPGRAAAPAAGNEPPLPPEPPTEDEEEYFSSSPGAAQSEQPHRRDPEEKAIELLTAQLGARTVDEPRR